MTTILSNLHFSDYDSFAQGVHGWDVDFLQLDRGKFFGRLFQFVSNDHVFARARFSRKLDQRGGAPKGLWTFAIVGSKGVDLVFKNHTVDETCVMIYPPGSDVSAISKSHFDILTFSTTEEYLVQLTEKNQLPDFRHTFDGMDVITCSKTDMANLRHLLTRLYGTVNKYNNHLWEIFDESYFTRLVFETLFKAIYHKDRLTPPPSPGLRLRDMAFRQAIECIKLFSNENLTVRGLVNSTGVSERTLEYVFLERLGVSPNQYIRTFRLNQVKRQIHESVDTGKTISQIANDYGFWHMGQFAQDYKNLFHELPSETKLKKVL